MQLLHQDEHKTIKMGALNFDIVQFLVPICYVTSLRNPIVSTLQIKKGLTLWFYFY